MSHPGVEHGYALDFVSVIRHVATELDRAAPAALSVDDLASGYRHVVSGDLARVRHHHALEDDQAAVRFLIQQALDTLGGQVAANGNGYHLTKPFDELRYNRRPIGRVEDPAPWPGGRGALDPMTNKFAHLLDRTDKQADEELRESMRTNGWLPDMPAIVDERGFVLVGNRRMRIAGELEIEPVTRRVTVGKEGGDSGEASRLRLAIFSNYGTAKMTATNRKRIARHLYGEENWSQDRIAEALNVSQSTVRDDVAGISRPTNSDGSKKAGRGRPAKLTEEQVVEIGRLVHVEGKGTRDAEIEVTGIERKHATMPARRAVDQERHKYVEPEPAAPSPSAQTHRCPTCGHEHSA